MHTSSQCDHTKNVVNFLFFALYGKLFDNRPNNRSCDTEKYCCMLSNKLRPEVMGEGLNCEGMAGWPILQLLNVASRKIIAGHCVYNTYSHSLKFSCRVSSTPVVYYCLCSQVSVFENFLSHNSSENSFTNFTSMT